MLALAECGCDVVLTGNTGEDDATTRATVTADLEGSTERTTRDIREQGVGSIAIQLNVRDESFNSPLESPLELAGRFM